MGAIKDGKVVINAVHERDAKGLWKKLKLKEKEPCMICKDDVTYNDFSALVPKDGKVMVTCKNLSCLILAQHEKEIKSLLTQSKNLSHSKSHQLDC